MAPTLVGAWAIVFSATTGWAATLSVPASFSTIQSALDAAGPGDTIEVDAGVYSEKLVFTAGGSAGGGFVALVAAAGAATPPVIDGTGVGGDHMILIDDLSYVRVAGFEIRNNLGANDGSGIRVTGSGTDIEILDNEIHDIRGDDAMGITVYGTEAAPIENLTIDGNEIHDCEPARSEALTLNGNITDFAISNNIVRDVNSIGIDMIGGETDIQPNPTLVVRNGVVRGNTVIRANSDYGGGFGAGIYCDGCRDVVIENNLVTESDMGVEIGAENSGLFAERVLVRNNILHRNERAGLVFGGFSAGVGRVRDLELRGNTLFENNTVGNGGAGRFFNGGGIGEIWVQYAETNVIENNIVYAGAENIFVASFDGGSSVANTFDYNLYYSAAGAEAGEFSLNGSFHSGFTAWRAATGQDASSAASDPQLVDPAGADFHVASTSPAVDAGNPAYVPDAGETDLDGAPRLAGAGVDVGADEATCGDGTTDPGEDCDDGNATSGDGCDVNCTITACGNGVVTPTTGEQCDDGATAGGDCCDAVCQHEAPGASCDDGAACTTADACDGAGTCIGAESPAAICVVPLDPGGSTLKLKDSGDNDKLAWKWGRGPAVAKAELDDPTNADDYALCVYVDDGVVSELVVDALVPAGPAWQDKGDKGYRYKVKTGTPDGITRLQVRPGAERKAKLKAKGKGASLGLTGLGFGAGSTVTVQLRGGPGSCFGAVYDAPFKKDDTASFVGRSN